MKWPFFTRRSSEPVPRQAAQPDPDPLSIGSASDRAAGRLDFEKGVLYRFKRDVLLIVAKLNQGVLHPDCEILKRQTIFVQTQLFHSLYNDPTLAAETREMLMRYHLRSVKATIGDRRDSKQRTAAAETAGRHKA